MISLDSASKLPILRSNRVTMFTDIEVLTPRGGYPGAETANVL